MEKPTNIPGTSCNSAGAGDETQFAAWSPAGAGAEMRTGSCGPVEVSAEIYTGTFRTTGVREDFSTLIPKNGTPQILSRLVETLVISHR